MSFSQDVKDEVLNNISKRSNSTIIECERFGEYLAESTSKYDISSEYSMFFDISKLSEIKIQAILKGLFLSTGCIVDPQNDYHFEIVLKNKACADYLINLLSLIEFTPKCIRRATGKSSLYVVYIKDSEQISTFLSMIEASNSLLKYEQIRVEKDVKNNINRNINCETANNAKVLKSAVTQINAIEKLKSSGRFNALDEKLKYVAKLRLSNIEASLDELASISQGSNRLSKSGIKHRLDKIIEIAGELS